MKRNGGGKLTIKDFIPEFAREKKEPVNQEENLKGFLVALSNKKPKE